MITAYDTDSTATTSDYTYDGTASLDYERWYENEDDLFARNETLTKELKRLENIKQLKQFGRVAFYEKWPLLQVNTSRMPLNIYLKMPRCNRHGLGLRIRRDK